MTYLITAIIPFLVCASFNGVYSQNMAPDFPNPKIQITTALHAAPAEKKDGAKVYGYAANGEMILLRKGNNDFVCVADDPQKENIHSACYVDKLEPFMTRGRELAKAGKSPKERFEIREEEVKSGELMMPTAPSPLFVFDAEQDQYDPTTGNVKEGRLRYVIYISFATAESTGLPTSPSVPGMPWIMDPGTHRAHIMITPPK